MKYRNGFVSNSSTSSFCIFGFLVPGSEENWINGHKIVLEKLFGMAEEDIKAKMRKDKYWKDEVDDPEQVQEYSNEMFYELSREKRDDGISIIYGDGAPSDGIVIGKNFIHTQYDDSYIEKAEYDLDGLKKLMEEVAPIREKMGCPDTQIKLYTGTINC